MTFNDCIDVIRCDLRCRHQRFSLVVLFKDPVARFHVYLRLTEYLGERSKSPLYWLVKWRFLVLSSRLGFSIPENTLAPGVYLPHYGTVVVNSRARVGEKSVLNVGVVIGRHPNSKDDVPVLGRGVYVGPGAKIFGAINLGDGCVIGANSVVDKNVAESELWVGIPAKFKRKLTEDEYQKFIPDSDTQHGAH